MNVWNEFTSQIRFNGHSMSHPFVYFQDCFDQQCESVRIAYAFDWHLAQRQPPEKAVKATPTESHSCCFGGENAPQQHVPKCKTLVYDDV